MKIIFTDNASDRWENTGYRPRLYCIQEFFSSLALLALAVTGKPGDPRFSHAQTFQAMKPKKSFHELSVVHYMLIVETGETVASWRVYTPCDVTRCFFGTSPWKTERSFWDYFGLRKKTFSRPEMLLRLENYESLDHRLRFPWKVHEKVILQRGGFRPLCEASPCIMLLNSLEVDFLFSQV